MPSGLTISPIDFYYILPELVLTAGALLVLIADVLLPRGSRTLALDHVWRCSAPRSLSLVPFSGVDVEVANGLIAVDRLRAFLQRCFLRSPPS